jgi:hypothetical protein
MMSYRDNRGHVSMISFRDILLSSSDSVNNVSAAAPLPRDETIPDSYPKALQDIICQPKPFSFDEKMAKIKLLTFFQKFPEQFDTTKAFCERYQIYPEAVDICLTNCFFLQKLITIDDAKKALDYIFHNPTRKDILNRINHGKDRDIINNFTYYNIGAYTACAAESGDSHYVDIFQMAKAFQTAESDTLALLNVFVDIIKINKDVHRFSLLISRETLARLFVEAPFVLVQQYVESLKKLDQGKKSVKSNTRNFLLTSVDEKVLPTMVSRFWKALSTHEESEVSVLARKVDLYWDMIKSALDSEILSSEEVSKLRASVPGMMDDQSTNKFTV